MGASPAQLRARSGFRAADFAAVLGLFALLAGVVTPEMAHRAALRRDEQRLEGLRCVQDAIERYHRDTGAWPAGAPDSAADGWDASCAGAFLPELVEHGYLAADVHDPIDDERFHYRYRRYDPGLCDGAGPEGFYVLGVRAFETAVFAARRPGGFRCATDVASGAFAHVTGGGVDGR